MVGQNTFRMPVWVMGLTLAVLCWALPAGAQVVIDDGGSDTSNPGGVYIDNQGAVRSRVVDADKEAAAVRNRINGAAAMAKDAKLVFISLPRLFAEVEQLTADKKEIPDDLRYLGGMTQLRYVLVDAEEKDLVIAGPFEPIDATSRIMPVGKTSGRPVLQLDDLVVALRTSARNGAFGCTIDPAADSLQKSTDVMRKFANATIATRVKELAKALGSQRVGVFGVEPDTRTAMACVTADYKLKRIALGIDSAPVGGVGHAIDNSRQAAQRVWFETMYEPLLISKAGDVYEIRGQRLQLKAGAQSFDARGATPKAEAFAKAFTSRVPALATALPVFADLQNIADLSLLASLIRADKLEEKTGVSFAKFVKSYSVAQMAVPKTAETLTAFTAGSIVAGGVSVDTKDAVKKDARKADDKGDLAKVKDQANKARGQKTGPVAKE